MKSQEGASRFSPPSVTGSLFVRLPNHPLLGEIRPDTLLNLFLRYPCRAARQSGNPGKNISAKPFSPKGVYGTVGTWTAAPLRRFFPIL